MESKQFNLISRICALIVLAIASITYITTVEPTTSFWDCGEFIASSYKLEVGHPPGNPVFQLIARVFTIFASSENAAYAVNIMSALCSAFTIFFLFLTIVHFGRKLVPNLSLGNAIAVLGAGVVGSLSYCWSDTFWFSAVEAEVYAMSSLFTAVIVWAMLKWEEAEEPYANRWIILIAFLMGLSVGVHLLNLLAIPALAFVYHYKTSKKVNFTSLLKVLAISVAILAVILYGIIPYIPKFSAYFDLLFVNKFNLPYNSGAIFFLVLLFALSFFGIYLTMKKGKVLLNTILLSFVVFMIGYSSFAVIVIRSSANPPTNEYQPDNPYTLVRYLGREQYGSNPLIYGESYKSPIVDYKTPQYYTPLDGKYISAPGPIDVEYAEGSQMLFPRMWSISGNHKSFYDIYNSGKGPLVPINNERMPSLSDNLAYFFDFQVNWMYVRYFMWNFAGRQNDIHSPTPGNKLIGNWESGIGFLDKARLGNQSVGPDYLINSKSKNHYYMLPLLLGLLGLFFQISKDKRNSWIVGLLFLLTGIAIVVYLNQPPYQVRERDYAYAGSFYAFSIWIGLGVLNLYNFVLNLDKKKKVAANIVAPAVVLLTLLVPIQMASENWDDHDRSGRYTVRDIATNYLIGTGENAIMVTHGDNDTFPLWYIQEVENVRTDVRILNTSLLGTDWYIDQMKYKINESDPLPISIERKDYLYGTNENVQIVERFNKPILLSDAIRLFKDPRITIEYYGEKLNYLSAKELIVPVNVENVKKYGIVAPEDYDKIQDSIVLRIPDSKNSLNKPELIILDILSNYNWDRPIYFGAAGGDLNIGISDYLQFEGFSSKFVPIQSKTSTMEINQIAAGEMYNNITNVFKWDAIKDTTINVDYQNLYTINGGVINHRNIFLQTALGLAKDGDNAKAIEILDLMQKVVPTKNYPLNTGVIYSINEYAIIQAVELYYRVGAPEKGRKLAQAFTKETLKAIDLYISPYGGGFLAKNELDSSFSIMYYLLDVLKTSEDTDTAQEIEEQLRKIVAAAS